MSAARTRKAYLRIRNGLRLGFKIVYQTNKDGDLGNFLLGGGKIGGFGGWGGLLSWGGWPFGKYFGLLMVLVFGRMYLVGGG